MRLQGFRDLRSAGRGDDGIVGSLIGPAGDNAEFTDLIWVRLRLIAGRKPNKGPACVLDQESLDQMRPDDAFQGDGLDVAGPGVE